MTTLLPITKINSMGGVEMTRDVLTENPGNCKNETNDIAFRVVRLDERQRTESKSSRQAISVEKMGKRGN